ncbi:EF-hand domain-containing protein [Polynucleobacter sp. UK-Gri1-W3]|jgi:Ca2+-binding EF-hand superfamily protein|uniref:EF-hand domain-containing protein n=1 Tax=Polynucleobacter sp. UK-Gri1-W3 TaxID=1819737 RepID=UPI001C0C9B7F|nr:EF-hand domain-containing protein [Polynucleobacter sp. UK-Gri1-W3]MBU3539202.1 EF-hand domain-containing protein [Polynucleobacter sp. UK-Gri1-W3]
MKLLSKLVILFGLNLLMLVPLIAQADDASRDKEIAERFAKCDTNHDGRLTKEEAKGCMPRIYDHFSYIDSTNKGYVTVAEIQAMASR